MSVGSTLSLGCGLEGADSDSNINYIWSSTNGPLPPRASVGEGILSSPLVFCGLNGLLMLSTDGVLVIHDVRLEDSGVYTCTANSVSGNITVQVSRKTPSNTR